MVVQHAARCLVRLRAQTHRFRLALAAQIQVAVAQASFLADLAGGCVLDLERQRRRLVQHLQVSDVDLDLTGGEVRVRRALRAWLNRASDLDDKLAAQVMRGLRDRGLTEDHLSQPRAVAQVDKDHAAMVATAGHPAGESDSLAFEFFIQVPRKVSAQHGFHVLPRDGESNLAKFTRR